ncbi:Ig-like domain-containing protein [Clostridium sp.]|uniref:Ig-like domain-containing protein n=1 Tax=Clostridium sp. TaxID=1506 RepID=UPI002E774A96|nr:Ig-like domain-containing protein [Clostridium sp.]MEE0566943.1 Ig-like domain-containing protein [Clostridium sp.]
MKRKLILMAIIAFSGFSIEANAAVNDEALSNVQNKMIEYINNYSFSNNADESATEGTTNNTVDFNWSDYVNNAGNVYKDAVEQIVSELPEITVPETSVQSPETSEAPDISVTPDITEDSGSINEDVLIQPFVIDNILRIVHVGESYTINVLHSPGEVVFTSSNPEVATVDGNGNVVAIAPGKAYITVSTADSCRTRKAVVRALGENELPDVDLPDTDNDINIDTDINIGNDNNINIDISINKPSGNWPSINWPTGGTIGGTTGGTIGSLGSANKISTTPTTLSSTKGTSTSTLPNTGAPIPVEAIGVLSLLGGLGIYKKRK